MDGDFNVVRWDGPEALLNQRVCKVTSSSSDLDGRFLYWWLQPHLERIHRRTPQTTVKHLSVGEFFRIPRPAFPVEEQRVFASVLDAVDEAIAKTEAVIAKLRQVRAGLLHDLLTRGLDENGHLRDPIAHPEQFKDSPLGRIPKAWKVTTLEELADVDRGKFAHRPRNEPRFYGGHHPFVQTGDITAAKGEVLNDFTQTLNDDGAAISREFPTGTIAITIAANIADTAILGRSMFLTDSVVGAVVRNPHCVRFVELGIRRAKDRLKAGAPQTAQMNINLQDLRPLKISVPIEFEEQHQIGAIYDTHTLAIRKEEAILGKLEVVKSGLMTDLLTGRVRVPKGMETP
ncbi:MAG: restriction endonuclease subunit S [Verrucomicrobiae bacterium]|nr:restriction endonuclease subunit S [Verrucomicrobiae bacterium]